MNLRQAALNLMLMVVTFAHLPSSAEPLIEGVAPEQQNRKESVASDEQEEEEETVSSPAANQAPTPDAVTPIKIEDLKASAGPLMNERLNLVQQIKEAAGKGVGTALFAREYAQIEELVKNAEPEQVKQSIDALREKVEDQRKRQQEIKQTLSAAAKAKATAPNPEKELRKVYETMAALRNVKPNYKDANHYGTPTYKDEDSFQAAVAHYKKAYGLLKWDWWNMPTIPEQLADRGNDEAQISRAKLRQPIAEPKQITNGYFPLYPKHPTYCTNFGGLYQFWTPDNCDAVGKFYKKELANRGWRLSDGQIKDSYHTLAAEVNLSDGLFKAHARIVWRELDLPPKGTFVTCEIGGTRYRRIYVPVFH